MSPPRRWRSGADGVMIGRAVMGGPGSPPRWRSSCAPARAAGDPALAAQKEILLDPLSFDAEPFRHGARVAAGPQASVRYSRGLPGSAEFRAAVNRLTEVADVLALIDRFFDRAIAAGATRAISRDAILSEAA